MKGPLVSVLLPVYNDGDSLPQALESITAQTLSEWECILINDGSDGPTNRVCRRLVESDPRIRLLAMPHRGIAAALNAGLGVARGRYIARMDADDVSLPRRLALQAEWLENHPQTGCVAGRVALIGGCNNQGFARYVEWTNTLRSAEDIFRNRFVESPLVHPSVMFRRGIAQRYGGYRTGNFPEDYELWLRWMQQGVRFYKLAAMVLQWRDRLDRLSRTGAAYRRSAFFRCKAVYLSAHLQKEPRPIWVWGASRIGRRRARLLEQNGTHIAGFITTDTDRPFPHDTGYAHISFRSCADRRDIFIVSFVAAAGARQRIRSFLEAHGRREGTDFICAA